MIRGIFAPLEAANDDDATANDAATGYDATTDDGTAADDGTATDDDAATNDCSATNDGSNTNFFVTIAALIHKPISYKKPFLRWRRPLWLSAGPWWFCIKYCILCVFSIFFFFYLLRFKICHVFMRITHTKSSVLISL